MFEKKASEREVAGLKRHVEHLNRVINDNHEEFRFLRKLVNDLIDELGYQHGYVYPAEGHYKLIKKEQIGK